MRPVLLDEAIDAFAGPGGWDWALKALGIDPLGIEWDDAACQTRAAAGLRTKQADVAALNPRDFSPCRLFLASPPCPTFSRAGKGDGIADMPLVYEAARVTANRKPVPELPWRDDRSALVVEPLRWVLALEPDFVAWEQVPDVLPFWEFCAEILRRHGWNVWTGVLEAERYGVAQTRERAILMASRLGPVHPPKPTHQRYVKGEPQRHDVTMEGEVLPWVSMAEALGWDAVIDRPAPTVTGGGTATGGPEVFGSQGRKAILEAVRFRNGNQENAAVRPATDPAPTIHFGKAVNQVEWVLDRRQQNSDGSPVPPVLTSRPAPTLTANWLGDPRLSSPTHHNHGEQNAHSIRVTLEEAAVLQSFPPDYPFQGTKSKRFEQVGNAVPPLLAHAVLSTLLAPVLSAELAEAA